MSGADGNPIVPVDVVQGIVQQLSTVSPEWNRMGLPPLVFSSCTNIFRCRTFVVHKKYRRRAVVVKTRRYGERCHQMTV